MASHESGSFQEWKSEHRLEVAAIVVQSRHRGMLARTFTTRRRLIVHQERPVSILSRVLCSSLGSGRVSSFEFYSPTWCILFASSLECYSPHLVHTVYPLSNSTLLTWNILLVS